MSALATLQMPRLSGEHLTEVLPDGRHVINREWVMPHNPYDGCWCGETLYGPCAHQRRALSAVRVQGLIPMPSLSLDVDVTTRIASEAASHPGIGQREWLRLLARLPDEAWRIAGYRGAVAHEGVVAALRRARDPRVTRRLLLDLPVEWWRDGRSELLGQVGELAGAIEARWLAARRASRDRLRVEHIRAAARAGSGWAATLLADLGWEAGTTGLWRHQRPQRSLPRFADGSRIR